MVKVAELTEQEKVIANLKKQVNDIPRSKRPNGKVQKTGQSKRYEFSAQTNKSDKFDNFIFQIEFLKIFCSHHTKFAKVKLGQKNVNKTRTEKH